MLRGPQTPGELKQRGQRLHDFAGLEAVQETLERLVERGQVARHERRPGQKEDRYEQLLGGDVAAAPPAAGAAAEAEASPEEELAPAEDRLTRLEREFGELRAELAALRAELGG
jgi:uncharacterized protein YceH (UPF0502 family)